TKQPFTKMVYQPMVELLAYLRANGFKTFIVSGGGIEFMRPWTEGVYGIPPEQVVGSSGKTKYEMRDGKPVLVKLAEVNFIDDKEGKPIGINQHIGRKPVLSAGNVFSGGDIAMLTYCQSHPGATLQLMVNHDDAAREFAYAEPDATMIEHATATNERLLKVFPKGFALDASHRPHITLVQRFVLTENLDKVYAAVGKVFASANVTGLKLEAFKYYYIPDKDLGV